MFRFIVLQIEIEVTLQGHHVCSELKLLFVPRDQSQGCPWKHMCKANEVIGNTLNDTKVCRVCWEFQTRIFFVASYHESTQSVDNDWAL